tara:strand:- start:129 stop:308 length:180 start_codon:yes stop_codon:yes gene_type:complete
MEVKVVNIIKPIHKSIRLDEKKFFSEIKKGKKINTFLKLFSSLKIEIKDNILSILNTII